MPTIEEIAEIAQVSRSTVSRVINDDPHVSEPTRSRVMKIIHDLDFQPNWAARRLAGGCTQVLGLVIPKAESRFFTDPYFPLLIQGISSVCNANDYSMMLWLAEPGSESLMIRQISNRLVDGLIIPSMVIGDPLVQNLMGGELPLVLVGRYPSQENACIVDVDNRKSAYNAVMHLLRLGRRNIATITGPQNMYVGIDRQDGYLAALREWGLAVSLDMIVEGDFTEESGYEAAFGLLPSKPDAIFAASDTMAVGALRALHDAGVSVPQEIAVVGFDDMPFAARSNPPLTTIRQPIHRMGIVAAEQLLKLLDEGGAESRRFILPTELVVRESCGAGQE